MFNVSTSFLLHLAEDCVNYFTAPVCAVEIIDVVLQKMLSVPASLLFVVDESGSVGPENFDISKEFIKSLVDKYP